MSMGTMSLNEFSEGVVDRQAGEVRWFLNGTPNGVQPIPKEMTAGIHAAGHDITIPSKHKPFRGLIGDFRIYRRAVSAERVRELFQDEAARYTSTDFRRK